MAEGFLPWVTEKFLLWSRERRNEERERERERERGNQRESNGEEMREKEESLAWVCKVPCLGGGNHTRECEKKKLSPA